VWYPLSVIRIAVTDMSVAVLMVTGKCLGRTPGFKGKDVDRALSLASFAALCV